MRRNTYRRSYTWNGDTAYLAGLIASDGCLINDGRHIAITSSDFEIVKAVRDITQSNAKLMTKQGKFGASAYDYHFSDVALYDFLVSAGITPAKSRTIRSVILPDGYYPDFLRGYFDGDGTVSGYKDSRWANSYMYHVGFVSASYDFLVWMQSKNTRLLGASPGSIRPKPRSYTLEYAKTDSRCLFVAMYRDNMAYRLPRKYMKLCNFITSDPYAKMADDARVLESVDRLA